MAITPIKIPESYTYIIEELTVDDEFIKNTTYYNKDGTYAGYRLERDGHVVSEVRLWESKLAQWFRTFRLNRWGQKRAKRKGYL